MSDYKYEVEVLCADARSIYAPGGVVRFFPVVKCNDSELNQGLIDWTLYTNGYQKHSSGCLDMSISGNSAEFIFDTPLCCRCVFEYTTPDGENITASAGAAITPEKINASWTVPDDFDEFWDKQKKRLAEIPFDYGIKPLPSQKDYEVSDLQISCVENTPVSGLYLRNLKTVRKKCPALLCFDGAGVRNSSIAKTMPFVEDGFIALSVNAHGSQNNQDQQYYELLKNGNLSDYYLCGIEDGILSEVYFTDMFLRAKRAVEFICRQSEWDGENLIVYGGSQGAWQCFAAAYLDSRVSAICTELPAGSNISQGGWPLCERASALSAAKSKKITECAAYFDNVSFASRLDIPMHTSVGFNDLACPPHGIYAMFNAYKGGEKEIYSCAKRSHQATDQNTRLMIDFVFKVVNGKKDRSRQ